MPDQLDYIPRRVRYDEALLSLDKIRKECREPGWDSYKAKPVSEATIEVAAMLMGHPGSPVYGEIPRPMADGGIEFEFDGENGHHVVTVQVIEE